MEQPHLHLIQDRWIRGSLIHEIYYSEDSQYGVFLMEAEESTETLSSKKVTIVGNMLRPHPDETYTCYGDWKEHPRFGQQYHIKHIRKEWPRSSEAVVKYLSSGLFSGIGKSTAQKIVKHLGADVLEKVSNNPAVLLEVPGISEARAQTIADGLQEHRATEQALVYLYQFGLGPAIALKVIQAFKERTMEVVKVNPYHLIEHVEGIGFRRADEIAQKSGVALDARERFQAAALFALQESSLAHGHVFVTEEELNRGITVLLASEGEESFPSERRRTLLMELVDEERIIEDHGRLYLPSLYYAEDGVARRIGEWLEKETEPVPAQELYGAVGEIEESLQVTYAGRQREAMTMAMNTAVMILTGGPGTGKTTVIRGICHLFSHLNECSLDPEDYTNTETTYPIRLVAPTGRAAKRMSETTGIPAMTIHRLLGWKGDFFERDANCPIEGSLLIVDEFSMVDIWLANQLFRAVPEGMKVILVGDDDQLPSVGPGKVLQDLLQIKEVSRVQLTEIYRQEEGSSIIQLAHALKQGEIPTDLSEPQPDRRFFACRREQIVDVIVQTYVNALKRGYTPFDVQVLAPMYKGPAGVNAINEKIQEVVNPVLEGKKEIAWGESIFRHGDKVLQLVNHSEHPVYNGDMGIITAMEPNAPQDAPVLWVQFDQQEVPYKRNQLNQLALAYACSVHKAQGSEFAIVIFPILMSYRRMLQKNLIYTGITRAKSYLILCGETAALTYGVKQQERTDRNSQLANLIQTEW